MTTYHKAKAGELLVDYLNDDEGFKECCEAIAQALADAAAAERERLADRIADLEQTVEMLKQLDLAHRMRPAQEFRSQS